jgi:hypothetical protein
MFVYGVHGQANYEDGYSHCRIRIRSVPVLRVFEFSSVHNLAHAILKKVQHHKVESQVSIAANATQNFTQCNIITYEQTSAPRGSPKKRSNKAEFNASRRPPTVGDYDEVRRGPLKLKRVSPRRTCCISFDAHLRIVHLQS